MTKAIKETKVPKAKTKGDLHYLVAIGASAGGLEAIHEFFDNMPDNNNLSFIVIQHLSPDHKSLLVELVGRHTNMEVFEASNNLEIKRGCVYIIPNDKFIQISKDKLILLEKLPLKVPNNAIDIFMHSLAKEKKDKAIAVVLSGTGSDGTKGIAAVKEAGGLVIAQEPSTSKFDGMPNSAIASGNVDFIMSAEEMPEQIVHYIAETSFAETKSIDDEILDEIFFEIRKQAGFDFNLYKTPTITRRIFHRMMKKNFTKIEEYLKFLRNNVEECKELGKEFLINVTRFFRDSEAFDAIARDVFPEIIKQKGQGDTIKVWVSACSTGEEVYSLAILLDEALEKHQSLNLNVKFFGTDIDKSNIEIASRGYFPKNIEKDIDPERLKKYFTKQNAGYIISNRIRKQVVFAVHNIIKDPPFIKNDLVTCRNMLIYMNPALQQRVYSVLLFAANRSGYIFLGTTENANYIRQHIDEINGRWKIYKKISEARLTPYFPDSTERHKQSNSQLVLTSRKRESKNNNALWDDLKDTLLDEFNFAAFYIDNNFEIRETVGNFERVLSLPKKVLKLNLLRMLPVNISTVLIAEIKKAWNANERKVINNLVFQHDAKSTAVQVAVTPALPGSGRPYTMVAFHYMMLQEAVEITNSRTDNDYVLTLEEELNQTKESLQRAVEDLETANEELQSGNEELLSANEELQSSNEELQSLNEELHTLNTEHQLKIKELGEVNEDLNNYFRSSDIGQVFLDRQMKIRKFNPASARMINFIETDIGRPINHISTNIRYHGMIEDIEVVLRENKSVEKEVQLQNGRNILLTVMPYLTHDHRVSGAIISFVDITTITTLNNIIRGVFNSSLSSIFALSSVRDSRGLLVDFEVSATNHAGMKMVNREIDDLKGAFIKRDLNLPVFDTLFRNFMDTVETDRPLHTDIFLETSKIWLEVTAVKMADGVMATFSDITQKKSAEERLKKNYVELISTKQNLKKLNSQLEQKVVERTQLLSVSEERFRMVARATNDAIWDWDIVANNIWFSDAFYIKFGYDPQQPFTRKDWLDKIHPDERAAIEKSMHHVINAGSKHWTKEYSFRKSDGEYAHILDRGYVLHDDQYDTPFRMLGSMLDITELKRAEQEIANNIAQKKFLAESMPLIVWTTNAAGDVDFVNRQFEMYTGIRHDEALTNGWRDAVHPDDIPPLDSLWRESMQYGSDFQREIRMRMFTGEYHWNILRARAQKENGQVTNWVITTIDINDQKQLHDILEKKVDERTRELTKMNHALEISNNDLQQFASVASHDLQEPLRKIHLYANLINDRHGLQIDGAATYLRKILQSSARMKSIINNIMSYSKLSAENVEFQPTDINEMITELLEDLEISITERNASVYVSKFPLIDTIPGQIRQVFQNIIGNALKFSKPDVSPQISITAVRVDDLSVNAAPHPKGDYCCITIKDNGIGFNERFAESIFLLFHRLHSKDAYEGTGIGLSIAKKIIEKHHGLIAAKSQENEGSTFTIILPVRQNEYAL